MAYATENLGIVLMNQRRFSEAALQLASAIKPIESVASIDANNSGYQIELAKAFGWWADSEKAWASWMWPLPSASARFRISTNAWPTGDRMSDSSSG